MGDVAQMTKVQKAILDTVIQSGEHLSADQVYWRVKKQFPSIALGTIYRNLHQFADSKLIRRVARADAADYFEGNILPHDHALCIRCGQMRDIVIPNLKDFLRGQMCCEIISVDLTVNYICPECAHKEAEESDCEHDEAAQYKDKNDKGD
jgi:Fe2+ or Zn2+ uptake regulation protein